jgi:hypothetical protein
MEPLAIFGAESRPGFLDPDGRFRKLYGKFGQRPD